MINTSSLRRAVLCLVVATWSTTSAADHGNYETVLRGVESGASVLERDASSVPSHERLRTIRRLRRVIDTLEFAIEELEHVSVAGWQSAVGQECYTFCQSQGLSSKRSPEGAQCVSGENRAASAVGVVTFVHGCWPNCAPEPVSNAVSVGGYCFKPGQKQDKDRTDITVGCYCG